VRAFLLTLLLAAASQALAAADERVLDLARAQKDPFLASVKEFVEIESGSHDREGLDRLAGNIAARLKALGAEVQFFDPPADMERIETTPARPGRVVVGTLRGRGTKSILLLAHMDTVYEKGDLAKQPFRVEGDRAYGLGISDDKQAIAMLLHTAAILKALDFDEYGRITLLFNADEEVSSFASRDLITRLGAEHDVCLSFEASSESREQVSLVTSGLGQAILTVHGDSAHAANFPPNRGVNALYELAHQIGQLRDVSDFPNGLRVTWSVAKSGTVPNRIPDEASAIADIRVVTVDQLDTVESRMREIIRNQLLPKAKVELKVIRGRPPLQARPASRAVAEHARSINAEIGRTLRINDDAPQGGTDAAYAGLKARGAVLEHWGVHGANAHSSRAEYIVVSSIERRLYLTARMIMDVSRGKVAQ
jgi:glutamate carboxypeptidase